MTYQIPSNVYPRYWDEPPDPIPEAGIRAYVTVQLEMEIEDSFDPYDPDEVDLMVGQYLARLRKAGKARERFLALEINDTQVEDWDII